MLVYGRGFCHLHPPAPLPVACQLKRVNYEPLKILKLLFFFISFWRELKLSRNCTFSRFGKRKIDINKKIQKTQLQMVISQRLSESSINFLQKCYFLRKCYLLARESAPYNSRLHCQWLARLKGLRNLKSFL